MSMVINADDFKLPELVNFIKESPDEDETTDAIKNMLYQMLEVYVVDNNGEPLISMIEKDWKVFKNDDIAKRILLEIMSEGNYESFGMCPMIKVSYCKAVIDVKEVWNDFKDRIKTQTRFMIDVSTFDNMQWDNYLENLILEYKEEDNKLFYRARLHNNVDEVIPLEKMGPPPIEYSRAGRANPEGIVYLYLSDNEKTTLYEARATYLDIVSIGTFKIKGEKVRIMDFTHQIEINPIDIDDLISAVKIKMLIRTISEDLSKPMRRYDSAVEYVPTHLYVNILEKSIM